MDSGGIVADFNGVKYLILPWNEETNSEFKVFGLKLRVTRLGRNPSNTKFGIFKHGD